MAVVFRLTMLSVFLDDTVDNKKGKVIPLQARCGSEGG